MAVFYAGMLAGMIMAAVLYLMAFEFFVDNGDPEDWE